MSDSENFIEKGSQLIQNAANSIFPVFLGGAVSWTLKPTPSSIKKTKNLPFKQPRAELTFDLDKGVKSLYSHTVTRYGKKTPINIYQTGLKFPPLDIKSEQYHRLVEVAVARESWGKREVVRKPGESAADLTERATRLAEAYGCDRYWFAVPSSLGENGIHIVGGGKNSKLILGNRNYARQVAEINNLPGGVWKSEKSRSRLTLAYILSALLGIVLCLVSYVLIDAIMSLGATWATVIIMGVFAVLGAGIWLLTYFLPKGAVEPL